MSKETSRKNQRRNVFILALALLVLHVVGTTFYYTVEQLTLIDAIYFTSITLTTVGYGDFSPVTDAGKLFTAVYTFVGIGVFLAFAASFLDAALERVSK